jgi:hypothetical protein
MVEQIELLQRGLSSFAYSSFVPTERDEGSVLLDFFVTFCSHLCFIFKGVHELTTFGLSEKKV